MRYIEPDPPESQQLDAAATEERLRREITSLRRQLEEQRHVLEPSSHAGLAVKPPRPSRTALWLLSLGALAVLVVAFLTGYIPRQKREMLIRAEAHDQEQALPAVTVIEVGRSSSNSELLLPGNIQAVTEAPILARADGYVKRRMVDIGDRVQAGQPVAEIEAPEVDQQILQARAALQQAQAAVDQALATQQQGKSNTDMARVTADRWKELAAQGVVSRQDNDQYQAQYQSQLANLQALEKAVAAARSNVVAAEANVARLNDVQGYRIVRAPFPGVITLRNVDVGALVTTGSTLLFRIAQTGQLRTYVNVPQTNAGSIRVGQRAQISVSNLPGRHFTGSVARMADALDPATRTMLVEVQVPNPDGSLFPGMYAEVSFNSSRSDPPLLIPGSVLVIRGDGTQVALLGPDNTVHFQKIEISRDYGDRLEVASGLKPGDRIISNPGDDVREGVKVSPVTAPPPPAAKGGSK